MSAKSCPYAANDDIPNVSAKQGPTGLRRHPTSAETPLFHLEIFQRIQAVTNFSTCTSDATFDTFFLDLQHLLGYLSRSIKSSLFSPFGHFIGWEKTGLLFFYHR